MRVTDTHVYFWGSYLSNFAWAPFKFNILPADDATWEFGEIEVPTSEHCYMILKAKAFKDYDMIRQMQKAYDGKAVKALGRKVNGFDPVVWDTICDSAMHFACLNKFAQNPLMKHDLLDTGERVLVEASPLDKIWGVGLHEDNDLILDEANWLGQNRLGKTLMRVRSELK